MHPGRIVRIEVAFDVEEEVRRDEHRLDGEGNALLERLPLALRQSHEFLQGGDVRAGHRPPVGAAGERRQDPIDTARAGRGIADHDLLTARFLTRRRERSDDGHGADPLVERVLVNVASRQRLDERIVDEAQTQRVIAFRHRHADRLFRERIEVDEPRGLGLDALGMRQFAVHPQAQGDRGGIGRALPWQPDLELVVGIEIEAVRRLDVARIDAAQILEAEAVLDLNRLGQGFGRHRPLGDASGGRQILFHQHRRDSQDVADVVEPVAGIVRGKVAVGAKLDRQQIPNRVGVLGAVEPPGRDASGVGLHRGVGAHELRVEELDGSCDLLVGTQHVLGRHLPRLQLGQDELPAIAVARQRLDRTVESDVEAAGRILRVVALAARLFQERLGRRGEFRLAGRPSHTT